MTSRTAGRRSSRAPASSRAVASCTASRSPPSTRSPCIRKAAARRKSSGSADARSTRRAHAVRVVDDEEQDGQVPERGEVQRLVPGAHVHRAVAELAQDRRVAALADDGERESRGDRELPGDDAPAAEVAALDVEQVHRAAPAVRAAVAAPEELGHDRLGRRAARQREAVRAVPGDQGVVVGERLHGADGGRLLTGGQVAVAADAGELVLALGLGLELADEDASARSALQRAGGRGGDAHGRSCSSSSAKSSGCSARMRGTPERTMRRWWRSAASARSASPTSTASTTRPVLLDHLGEVARDGQAQPAHAREVAVGALADRPRDLAAAEVAEVVVELLVEREPGLEVVGVARALLTAQHVLEALDVVGRGALRGQADGGALDRLAEELRVAHGAEADGRDEGSRAAGRPRRAAPRAGAAAPRGPACGETPRTSASSFSESRVPGVRVPSMMAWRSAS